MNSQMTSCNIYHNKRQAILEEIDAREALLLRLYEERVEEVLSTATITCKVTDSTGIETARARHRGEVDGEDLHQGLSLVFTAAGQTFYINLFNGNTGCGEECDTKMHCHTWITHNGRTLGFFHGFKCGQYEFEGGEMGNLEKKVEEMFPDYASSIIECMGPIVDNLSDLGF